MRWGAPGAAGDRGAGAAGRTLLRQDSLRDGRQRGVEVFEASGRAGFEHRATHNLWILLREAAEIDACLANDSYAAWFPSHLDNSIYRSLVQEAAEWRFNQALT